MKIHLKKIRQKLLAENKISKYLLYAVGEIILVVIGILLALHINTTSQNRQRAKLEKVLLNQVKVEMLTIYEDIWRDAARLSIGDKSSVNINRYLAEDAVYRDSFCFDFYWIKLDEYIYPTEAAYSKIKEEGLDIIKNDTVRYYLQVLYEGLYPRIMKNNSFNPDISEVLNDYYLNFFKPNNDYTLKFGYHLDSDTVGTNVFSGVSFNYPKEDKSSGEKLTVGYVPLDFEALKKDTKFQMLLDQTNRYRGYKLSRYSSVKLVIKEVIEIIDRELEE